MTAAAHPITEVKLATTLIGLDSAVAGDPLNLGTQVLSEVANLAEIHIRMTNIVTTVSNTVGFAGLGIFFDGITERNV